MPDVLGADEIPAASDAVLQFRIFGHAQLGPNEVSAQHAEHPGRDFGTARYAWDHDQAWLSRTLNVQYGEDPRPWRPWSALPWITEHCLRGHLEWPGL